MTLGHAAGDAALIDTASILRNCFRPCDPVARTGGDEFVALVVTQEVPGESYAKRLLETIRTFNRQQHRAFELSMSVGEVSESITVETTLEALSAQADAEMYRMKSNRRGSRSTAATLATHVG